MSEKNYDFRLRHWQYHKPRRRQIDRVCRINEVELDESWKLGCAADAEYITAYAVKDFRDYLEVGMNISLSITHTDGDRVLWVEVDPSVKSGFTVEAAKNHIRLAASEDKMTFLGTIHLEDIMNLEGAPVLETGTMKRTPLYDTRIIHSGTGIDAYPDAELVAMLHAGYDAIEIFLSGIDRNRLGYCDFNDIIERAAKLGITTHFHNYIQTFIHPDDEGAQAVFDEVYGTIIKHYPKLKSFGLCGEALEFPSKDPATTGKKHNLSVIDGIPETKPSPGWYPCSDYPAYIQCIERAVHKVNPDVDVYFSTYNWGYQPQEYREKFLARYPENVGLSVCYEIFSRRKLGKLHTPVMDYTISADEPGYYFTSECETAHKYGIKIMGNVNTAGIAWDFGCVPLVPAPGKLFKRNMNLRKAQKQYNLRDHYTTHHYGWWNSVAADLGKWTMWEEFEPDYDELLRKTAVRDYGKNAAGYVIKAWDLWSQAMSYYVASNEDQYGPWRVGAAYPFIFQPSISRTMAEKDIQFPTAPHAHFGHRIIKTFYKPYENTQQTPGFLRYPAEIKSLEKMRELWNQGLAEALKAVENADEDKRDEARRLEALGHFIRNSINTVINIKRWYQYNVAMVNCASAEEANVYLDKLETLALQEIENARDTIPAVECDSRLGWEPSMEYVCDKWHLEWKIRQVNSALDEIRSYRGILALHTQD